MAVVTLSDVKTEPVSWLWDGWVPLGAITLLDGHGGTRKSTLTLNLAAAVTTGGRLLGGSPLAQGGVLLLGEEDDHASTVRPRLEAMGADLNRVVFFRDEVITLQRDLGRIENVVVERDVSLIIIDPLSGFLGTDSNREQDVRRVLTRVRHLAEHHQLAVLAIRHLTKASSTAQHSGVGSVGIGAVARSGLLLCRDPADNDGVVLANYKNNLAPPCTSIRLRFEGVVAERGR